MWTYFTFVVEPCRFFCQYTSVLFFFFERGGGGLIFLSTQPLNSIDLLFTHIIPQVFWYNCPPDADVFSGTVSSFQTTTAGCIVYIAVNNLTLGTVTRGPRQWLKQCFYNNALNDWWNDITAGKCMMNTRPIIQSKPVLWGWL